MKSILALVIAGSAVLVAVAGCASASESGQPVSGKVLTQSLVGGIFEDGDGCTAGEEIFLSFPGTQVTLKDSSGKILGVSNIELHPTARPKSGTQEGDDCAYYFTFDDVTVEDKFFTVEFGLTQLLPSTVTLEELTSGLVLRY